MILLLVMLPLQLGWAALGSYCQHEPDSQAKHFGHHFHQHKADSARDGDDGPDPETGKSLHGDCNACASAGVTPILSAAGLLDVSAAAAGDSGFLAHPLFRPATPPDRFDRSRLV